MRMRMAEIECVKLHDRIGQAERFQVRTGSIRDGDFLWLCRSICGKALLFR